MDAKQDTERESTLPGPDFELYAPDVNVYPWPILKQIQEHDAIFWSNKRQSWLITRHEDVKDGFADRRLSVDRVSRLFNHLTDAEREEFWPVLHYMPKWSVFADAPYHTKVRRMLISAFRLEVVERLRPFVEDAVEELLDDIERQKEVDFNPAFAFKLPALVIMKMLEIPRDRYNDFQRWSVNLSNLIVEPRPKAGTMAKATKVILEMNECFREIIVERRKNMGDDFLSTLINSVDKADDCGEDELLGSCQLVMLAGHETTTHMLGNGMLELIRNPEQRDVLLQDPGLIKKAVEELVRYNGVVGAFARTALENFDWRDKKVSAGDTVLLFVYAANRDPRVYENPEELDFTRDNPFPLSFGPGIHFCFGNQIARLELEVAYNAILRRFDKIEIMDKELDWSRNFILRGLDKLSLRFHSR